MVVMTGTPVLSMEELSQTWEFLSSGFVIVVEVHEHDLALVARMQRITSLTAEVLCLARMAGPASQLLCDADTFTVGQVFGNPLFETVDKTVVGFAAKRVGDF